jgi:argonaute-like protein implicated in RNA metabolism and viral defense
MVANKNPKMASARPVHYEVVINTTKMTKEQIIEMTYHQSYNYYGFAGPIKTPATVFYAKKIAKYAVDNYVI